MTVFILLHKEIMKADLQRGEKVQKKKKRNNNNKQNNTNKQANNNNEQNEQTNNNNNKLDLSAKESNALYSI